MNRKEQLHTDETYHIYNRGVDSRTVFNDFRDVQRFCDLILYANSITPIVHLPDVINKPRVHEPLVTVLGYCILNNHFHLLVQQRVDGGISEFMKRISGGYTRYFNTKYKRTGSLFQGKFKSKHIISDEYSVMITGYVHANYIIHPNKMWVYLKQNNMILSSLTEGSRLNPFRICTKKYNPLNIEEVNFKTWCENKAKMTYDARKENKRVRLYSLE